MAIKPGKYRHSKSGKEYQVIGLGKQSETLEEVVVYKPLYECETKYWVRPVGMWDEEVIIDGEKKKRFEKIEDVQETVLQVGMKALIKNREGKYLLVRRSLKKYPEIKGRWDIVGGRINTGADLPDNLKREIREETGLEIEDDIKLIAAQDIRRIPGKYVVRLTYLAQVKGKADVILDTSENDKYEWLTLNEVKKKRDIDIYFKTLINKL